MRLYDDNLNEIFVYSYSEGSEFSGWHCTYYSYKKVSYEEAIEADKEFKELEKQFWSKRKSGDFSEKFPDRQEFMVKKFELFEIDEETSI